MCFVLFWWALICIFLCLSKVAANLHPSAAPRSELGAVRVLRAVLKVLEAVGAHAAFERRQTFHRVTAQLEVEHLQRTIWDMIRHPLSTHNLRTILFYDDMIDGIFCWRYFAGNILLYTYQLSKKVYFKARINYVVFLVSENRRNRRPAFRPRKIETSVEKPEGWQLYP